MNPGADFDPRADLMAPPGEPCECYCLHCGRTFMSAGMWFQRVVGDQSGFSGFWMCPTPNCDGKGYLFDIFPTDPDHPDNEGWYEDDEQEAQDWDPDEPQYTASEEELDGIDEDIEGEEWKYGLEPGQSQPEPQCSNDAGQVWDQGQSRYDEPDERPREVDLSTSEDRPTLNRDEDLPF